MTFAETSAKALSCSRLDRRQHLVRVEHRRPCAGVAIPRDCHRVRSSRSFGPHPTERVALATTRSPIDAFVHPSTVSGHDGRSRMPPPRVHSRGSREPTSRSSPRADLSRHTLRRSRCHRARTFRPRGFSPPRRFSPREDPRACCIPLPVLGFEPFPASCDLIRRPGPHWRFPTRGFAPSEGLHSPAAAPRHRGRCPHAVPTDREALSPRARPPRRCRAPRTSTANRFRFPISTRFLRRRRLQGLAPRAAAAEAARHPPGSRSPRAGESVAPSTVSGNPTPYPSMGFVPLRGLHLHGPLDPRVPLPGDHRRASIRWSRRHRGGDRDDDLRSLRPATSRCDGLWRAIPSGP
jgi:hypothetical protein